jgi:formylglycine-generating enzyme required for sulfatase activity
MAAVIALKIHRMKLFSTVLICLLASGLTAQKKKDIPPGFAWVKERGLVVSKTEITVKQWVEFMQERGEQDWQGIYPTSNPITDKCVCSNDGNQITVFNPDQIVFRDTTFIEAGSKKGKKTRSEEWCSNMPVTGISIGQAQQFAEWLTLKYESDDKYAGLGLVFRLPTPLEMDIKPGQENFDAYKNGINVHGCAIYNHAHNSWCDNNKNMKMRYGYGVPMEVGWFFADYNGLMDVMGNVAEMTAEEGIAMGGSAMHPASSCQPGVKIPYEGPQWWLGFRLVAELK